MLHLLPDIASGVGPRAPVEPTEKCDILLVDDDANLRRALAVALERAGYSLQCAADGREAMDLLARRTFSLIITDLFMPIMDGLELIMKQPRVHSRIPIVAMSGGRGLASGGYFLKPARLLGCDRTLTKPFPLEDLLAVVQEILPPSPAPHAQQPSRASVGFL